MGKKFSITRPIPHAAYHLFMSCETNLFGFLTLAEILCKNVLNGSGFVLNGSKLPFGIFTRRSLLPKTSPSAAIGSPAQPGFAHKRILYSRNATAEGTTL